MSKLDRGATGALQDKGIGGAAGEIRNRRSSLMSRKYKVGDHVSWNSEAGRVRGRIIKVHTRDVDYKGYTHHASVGEPQYEIKSDKTDHIAMHKGSALRKIKD
jgi:hypothetical protein